MRRVERRLRERVKELEKEVSDLNEDRRKFRQHFRDRFRWWIELTGEQKTPKLSWLIEADAKFLSGVDWWPW